MPEDAGEPLKALVVFSDDDGHPLSFLLKTGFRHCFVCIASGGLWLRLDGRQGIPEMKYLTTADYDLAQFYRDEGLTVVETDQNTRPVLAPLCWRNCVGLVKAFLCLRCWALTPYGLYRYLTRT